MTAAGAAAADEPQAHPPAVKVLVVDDVAQNLVAMEALLTGSGVQVLSAPSGAQALELLLEHEVALALLDVQMPDMDGFALAELMRGAERTRGVPIIFLTAAPADGQRSFRGYEAGAVDFLYKPIDARVILGKVKVFVELYAQRRRLADSMAEMQRLLALNETMAAVLTHDLRTPLSAISMSAELLIRSQDERTRKAGERIKSGSHRMARMIADLLDFSRIRSGTLRLDRKECDVQELCRAAIAEVKQVHPAADIRLQAHGDLHGRYDPDRLSQIFGNLLANAVQHGDAARPIEAELDGDMRDEIVASIRNGGALPPEVQARLFEPFRSSMSGGEGLGLGLYIVAQFAAAHGGEAQGWSGDGETVFRVRLPR